jgi:hypothetical protein
MTYHYIINNDYRMIIIEGLFDKDHQRWIKIEGSYENDHKSRIIRVGREE